MAKCRRVFLLKDENEVITFLYDKYSFKFEFKNDIKTEYNGVELNNILVDITCERVENGQQLTISKLVSLKAFLLSYQDNTDINNLIIKIDKILNLSRTGLTISPLGILYNDSFQRFFTNADMKINIDNHMDYSILDDGKRQISVKVNGDGKQTFLDFNVIEEL